MTFTGKFGNYNDYEDTYPSLYTGPSMNLTSVSGALFLDTIADIISDRDQPWRGHSACAGMDPEIFFPVRGDNAGVARARAICATCPVLDECKEWSLGFSEWQMNGITGGMSVRERARIRRERKMASRELVPA